MCWFLSVNKSKLYSILINNLKPQTHQLWEYAEGLQRLAVPNVSVHLASHTLVSLSLALLSMCRSISRGQ